MSRIHDVIIKSCIAVEPNIVNKINISKHSKTQCFEIYGFDIILDQNLKPWLLEVNICPSLSSSSPLDRKIKTTLICDTLTLVGLQIFDRKKEDLTQMSRTRQRLRQQCTAQNGDTRNMSRITHRNVHDLENCAGLDEMFKMNSEHLNVIVQSEEELVRKGNFQRIFPQVRNIEFYSQFFETKRYNNLLLWRYLKTINREAILEKWIKREKVKDSVQK